MKYGFELDEAQFRNAHGQVSLFMNFMIKYYKFARTGGHLLIIFALSNRERVADL